MPVKILLASQALNNNAYIDLTVVTSADIAHLLHLRCANAPCPVTLGLPTRMCFSCVASCSVTIGIARTSRLVGGRGKFFGQI